MSTLLSEYGLDQLNAMERLRLVEEILVSIEEGTELSPLSEAKRMELERRIAALESDPENVRLWAEVKARILARLGQ